MATETVSQADPVPSSSKEDPGCMPVSGDGKLVVFLFMLGFFLLGAMVLGELILKLLP